MSTDKTNDELSTEIQELREDIEALLGEVEPPENDLSYSVIETSSSGRQNIVHWVEFPITTQDYADQTYSSCDDVTSYSDAEDIFRQAVLNRDADAVTQGRPQDGDREVGHGDILVLGCSPCIWVCYVVSVDRENITNFSSGFQLEAPTSSHATTEDKPTPTSFARRELIIWRSDKPDAWNVSFSSTGITNTSSSSSSASLSTLSMSQSTGTSLNVDHFEVSIGVPLGSFSLNSFDINVGAKSYDPSYEETSCCTDVSIGALTLDSDNTLYTGQTTWESTSGTTTTDVDIDTRTASGSPTSINHDFVDSVSQVLTSTPIVETSCVTDPQLMNYSSVSLGASIDSTLVKVDFACMAYEDDVSQYQCMTLEPVKDVTQQQQKHVIDKIDTDFVNTELQADITTGYSTLSGTSQVYTTQTKRLTINTTPGKLKSTNQRLLRLSQYLWDLAFTQTPTTLKPYTQTVSFPNGQTNLFTNEKLSIKNRTRSTWQNYNTTLSGNDITGNLVTDSFDITENSVAISKDPCDDPEVTTTAGSTYTAGGTTFQQTGSSSYSHSLPTIQATSQSSLGADVSLHSMTVSISSNPIADVVLDGLSISLGASTHVGTIWRSNQEISLGTNVALSEVNLDKLTASVANLGSSGSETISSVSVASTSSGGDSTTTQIPGIECNGVSLGAVSIYGNKLDISDVLNTQEGKKGYIPYLDSCPHNGDIYVVENTDTVYLGGLSSGSDAYVSLGGYTCELIFNATADIPVRKYEVNCGVLADQAVSTENKSIDLKINTGLEMVKMYEESVTIGANTHNFITRDATSGTGATNTYIGCMPLYQGWDAEDECCPPVT